MHTTFKTQKLIINGMPAEIPALAEWDDCPQCNDGQLQAHADTIERVYVEWFTCTDCEFIADKL